PQCAAAEGVARELDEVGEPQTPRLIAERVVEDPRERVDQEHGQEEPDQPDAERRHDPAGARGRRGRWVARERREAGHSSGRVSVADAGNVTRTADPVGSTSWCQGSPTSTLSTTPVPTSTS